MSESKASKQGDGAGEEETLSFSPPLFLSSLPLITAPYRRPYGYPMDALCLCLMPYGMPYGCLSPSTTRWSQLSVTDMKADSWNDPSEGSRTTRDSAGVGGGRERGLVQTLPPPRFPLSFFSLSSCFFLSFSFFFGERTVIIHIVIIAITHHGMNRSRATSQKA